MKIKELLAKDNKALQKLLIETKAKLIKERFKIASKETNNVSEVNKNRREIARIMTIIREKEILQAESKGNKK